MMVETATPNLGVNEMSVACYVRVSTVSQNEAGQVKSIQDWLKGHNVDNVVWYIDKATGTNLDRPEFQRLQQDVFNGTVKTIVIYKLDRVSRSLKDGINTITDWLEKKVRIVAVTQQLDFSGVTGKLIASVLFAVAEMENETRKERQFDGIKVAKENGVYAGGVAGRTKKREDGNSIKPREAIKLREKGLTYDQISTAMGISQSTVRRYLGVVSR